VAFENIPTQNSQNFLVLLYLKFINISCYLDPSDKTSPLDGSLVKELSPMTQRACWSDVA